MRHRLFACLALNLTLFAGCSASSQETVLGAVTAIDAGSQTPSPSDPSEPSDPTGPATPGPTGTGEPNVCERVDTAARPVIPRMLVLADRSNSMTQSTSASKCPPCFESRWDGSATAIKSISSELDDVIDFGLMLFPNVTATPSADGAGCLSGDVSVAAAPNTGGAIASVLDATKPGGATPTAKALLAAKRVLVDEPLATPDGDVRPSYVLLVTDGEPTCEDKDAGILEPTATHAALDELLRAQVPTYVVGYGIGGLLGPGATMDEMAMHGGTEHYYPAEGQAELVTALREITAAVVSCDFALENEPPRGDAYIHVTLDGKDVPAGDQGWVRNERVVSLRGAACQQLRSGADHGVQIVVECEPVQIL